MRSCLFLLVQVAKDWHSALAQKAKQKWAADIQDTKTPYESVYKRELKDVRAVDTQERRPRVKGEFTRKMDQVSIQRSA